MLRSGTLAPLDARPGRALQARRVFLLLLRGQLLRGQAGWRIFAGAMAILHLKAKPNSRTSQLLVGPDGTVTARLAAPAHDGQANAALQLLPAAAFGLPKRRVTRLAGHTAPFKKVELVGLSGEEMAQVLASL